MQKLPSLRAALVAAYPQLGRDPDRLTMWVDKGRIRSPMTTDRGFDCEYTLSITITDAVVDPAILWLAINDWLRINQPDLLRPGAGTGYTFEVDLIDLQTIDLAIELTLTEQIAVVTDGSGNTTIQYVGEPDLSWLEGGAMPTLPAGDMQTITAVPGTPPAPGG